MRPLYIEPLKFDLRSAARLQHLQNYPRYNAFSAIYTGQHDPSGSKTPSKVHFGRLLSLNTHALAVKGRPSLLQVAPSKRAFRTTINCNTSCNLRSIPPYGWLSIMGQNENMTETGGERGRRPAKNNAPSHTSTLHPYRSTECVTILVFQGEEV